MSETEYTVIGSPITRAFRVVWMLEEAGCSYTINPAKPHQDDIKQLNPSGKVPALVDHSADNAVILDSVAMVQYIADKHQCLTFTAGTAARGQQDSFTQFACDDMDGILWTLAKHTFVLPESLRATEAVRLATEWDFKRAMSSLEERLGNNEFVMGDQMTVPDIILCHCAGWADRSGLSIPDGALSNYFERLRQREAYQRSFALREQYA